MPHTTIQAYAALAVKFHLLPVVENRIEFG